MRNKTVRNIRDCCCGNPFEIAQSQTGQRGTMLPHLIEAACDEEDVWGFLLLVLLHPGRLEELPEITNKREAHHQAMRILCTCSLPQTIISSYNNKNKNLLNPSLHFLLATEITLITDNFLI